MPVHAVPRINVMLPRSDHLLLLGNGPYLNRGCEAIVRGTVEVLDQALGPETEYLCASLGEPEWIRQQANEENNRRIQHVPVRHRGRLCVAYAKQLVNRICGTSFEALLHSLPDGCPRAVLQVGGDNYTLDYGYPRSFMAMDREFMRQGLPLVLWSASVGPFSSDSEFEKEIAEHLKGFSLITVREGRSFTYLQSLGLTNLCRVADPAFVMRAEAVPGMELPEQFLGLNLSALAGTCVADGDSKRWLRICVTALDRLVASIDLPVLLIPHVFTPTPVNDDLAFLKKLAANISMPDRVKLLEARLTAPQLKWVIGKARAFAGARTHATIAALSQAVPTLCLAYSSKAWGLAEDLYGGSDCCLQIEDLERPDALAERLKYLVDQERELQARLRVILPEIQEQSYTGGTRLREMLTQWN